MLVTLEEGLLKFQFEEVSVPWKYDDSSFYRNQFQSFAGGTKGVDFLCHTKGTLWLIEVKDYRVYERQKSQDLSEEVEERVRDTLAGLVALRVNGNDLDERKRATAALKKKRLRVVLHLWDEGTKNGPDRSALLGHNFVYQETKPHGFYSSYFHQRISS